MAAGKGNEKNSFHPQAALLYKWNLHGTSAESGIKKATLTPSENKTIGVHSLGGEPYDPNSVMSKITNKRDSNNKIVIKDDFFNLETYKISSLVPELRFFKSIGEKMLPFYFPTTAEVSDEGAPFSLGAAAVRDFSVEFVGTNPYQAPRFLMANLTVFVDNVSLIFAEPKAGYARLADLFTISIARNAPSNLSNVEGSSTITPGDLRRPIEVSATLGYTFLNQSLFTQLEVEEIRESNLALRMNVISHSIDVQQDGSATINIKYTARIGDSLGDSLFSLGDSTEDTVVRADIRSLFRDGVVEAGKSKEGKTKENRTLEDYQKKLKEIRRVMEILESKNKIHEAIFDDNFLFQYSTYGKAQSEVDPFAGSAAASTATLTDTKAQLTAPGVGSSLPSLPPTDEPLKLTTKRFDEKSVDYKSRKDNLDLSKRTIHYVALGDLMQAFFEKSAENIDKAIKEISNPASEINKKYPDRTSEEKEKIKLVLEENVKKLKKFRVLLSDVNIKIRGKDSTAKPEIKKINLADVPISLALWSKVMKDEVISNYDKTYTIYQFLNKCVSHIIPEALHKSFLPVANGIVESMPTIISTTYTGRGLSAKLSKQSILKPSNLPGSSAMKSYSFEDDNEYFVIFQESEREFTPDGSGIKKQDSDKGIYHFEIGKNRGLIKSINFSRFDVPKAQEQLMTNQVGLYDELKMPYSATIEMIGNNLFMPGSQIYVNPGNIGFGLPNDKNSASHRLGLGGYYTILSVTTNVSNGISNTSLKCSFGAHASERKGLTDAVPITETAGEISQSEPGADAQELPTGVPTGSSDSIQATSGVESKLKNTLGIQVNLSNSISEHFTFHDPDVDKSWFAAGTARSHDLRRGSPVMGVDRVRYSADHIRYYINSSFDAQYEYVDIYFDENRTIGQIESKKRGT
ncbi:MAG: hypothetical protein CL431_10765 [Acidimicrobiaceae bacterium]|nr:hypothetical protein [Acidimicrobiaceae bacterium]|tara:strand:- start:3503 stop:6247 length:2745 start_codon:yes stop_codon:yes gene_type:complete